jgi:hypothetical protein
MSTGEKIFSGLLMFFVTLAVVAMIYNSADKSRRRSRALDACWACGWGRVEDVNGEYRCEGWEDGGEVVRSVEWVQENACQVGE